MIHYNCKEMTNVKKQILKVIGVSVLFLIFIITVLFVYADRIEKIENNELTQVSESYMDR